MIQLRVEMELEFDAECETGEKCELVYDDDENGGVDTQDDDRLSSPLDRRCGESKDSEHRRPQREQL